MQVESLGWRTDLSLLEQQGSVVENRGDHLLVRSPHNPMFWWGNFLLLDRIPEGSDSERWVEYFRRNFVDADHVAMGFDGREGSAESLSWFGANGFAVSADAVMTASAADLSGPPAVRTDAVIRPLRSRPDWAQSIELQVRSNDRPVDEPSFREYAAGRAASQRALVEGGKGEWFGAFAGGRLVSHLGIVDAGAGLARYQNVATHPDHRRQGLAGALVHRAGSWAFDQLAARTLVIVADPDYVAVDLYRKLGFSEAEAQLRVELPPERL